MPQFLDQPPPQTEADRQVFASLAANPFTLGAAVGVINGVLAYKRDQYISYDVLTALAVPTMVAEAYLHWRATAALTPAEKAKKGSVMYVAALTGLGLVAGAALFVRWDPRRRGFIESAQATRPGVATPRTPAQLPAPSLVV